MKLVNLTCPNCNGILERVGDNLFCKSCGGAFAIDFDDADVEHEKLQTEDVRAQRELEQKQREFEQQKEMMEIRFRQQEQSRIAAEKREARRQTKKGISRYIGNKISGLFAFVLVIGFFVGCYKLCVHWGVTPSIKEIVESAKAQSTQYASMYKISESDVTKEILDNMISAGESNMFSVRSKGITEKVNKKDIVYTLDKAQFESAYLITNNSRSNKIVILYELTFSTSEGETKTTYDACSFEGLKLSSENKLQSDYVPKKISKSKTAWKYDSYEERDQCYRECVLGAEGTATELKRK
ncbi:MAG: hypothetical protein IKG93_07075 [Clostridiales bacterium]|nr:hypothetical protein [Clostridiales bacterium]